MDAVLFRTAMSPGIREQHDEFPMIAERKGRMVVGQFGSFIGGFLDAYEGTVEEGDIFLTSDPYKCDGAISHSADWLVLLPIYYRDGRLVGWAAMLGHMSDVGGKVPGSLPTDATSIFEEGMLAPPIKIYRGGALQEDLIALVLDQVRMPLESQRFERDRRGLPHRRTPRDRDVRSLRGRPLRLRDGSFTRKKPARDGRTDQALHPGGGDGVRGLRLR